MLRHAGRGGGPGGGGGGLASVEVGGAGGGGGRGCLASIVGRGQNGTSWAIRVCANGFLCGREGGGQMTTGHMATSASGPRGSRYPCPRATLWVDLGSIFLGSGSLPANAWQDGQWGAARGGAVEL